MAIHKLIFGTSEIVLHFRYVYFIVHAVICTIIYLRLRDKKLFAAAAALLLFMFTPYDITALSYNTMGLDLVALTCVLLATANSKKVFFIAGITFALAVLCCPYLIIEYCIFLIGVSAFAIYKKSYKNFTYAAMFTAGAAAIAVILLIFILSRAKLGEFIKAIPNIFTDPEHQGKTVSQAIQGYFKSIIEAFRYGKFYLPAYLAAIVLALIDKNRYNHQKFYISASILISILMLWDIAPEAVASKYNYIMFPIGIIGLIAYIVTENKNKKIFTFMYLGAILYTICICFSSNQYFYIISAMSAITSASAIILLSDALYDTDKETIFSEKRFFNGLTLLIIALAIIQTSLMTNVKIHHKFFSNSNNSDLTETIAEGPYKGIKVTPDANRDYIKEVSYLDTFDDKNGSVLYATSKVWYYLVTPHLSVGAYSPWLSGENDTSISRLAEYYRQNPKKLPDYIFIPSANSWNMELFKKNIINAYGYTESSTPGGTLYTLD